jgi:hypothetical protein
MKNSLNKIKAYDIKKLLEEKHAFDIYESECKDGPSMGKYFIMDGWGMTKSWANNKTFAYEIKVSRSDFLNDNKWHNYLQYCNEFSFVCPSGLIKPEEVPEKVGLYYVSKTGTRIFTKKKPIFRENEVPVGVLMYLMFWRNVDYKPPTKAERREFWEDWLKEKKLNYQIGHSVSKSLAEKIEKEIDNVKHENSRLREEHKELKEVREFLNKIGVDYCRWDPEGQVKKRIDEIQRGLPHKDLDRYLETVIDKLIEIKGFYKKEG